jgi:glycerophosphoryl diester phosphodiesterase
VQAFIEIKEESLDAFGIPYVLDRVNAILEPIKDRCIVISYSFEALQYTRDISTSAIGWILGQMDAASCDQAHSLNPDYLICNYKKIPDDAVTLWTGPWQWVLYEIDKPELALELAKIGVEFIETMAIQEMLEDPDLRTRGMS